MHLSPFWRCLTPVFITNQPNVSNAFNPICRLNHSRKSLLRVQHKQADTSKNAKRLKAATSSRPQRNSTYIYPFSLVHSSSTLHQQKICFPSYLPCEKRRYSRFRLTKRPGDRRIYLESNLLFRNTRADGPSKTHMDATPERLCQFQPVKGDELRSLSSKHSRGKTGNSARCSPAAKSEGRPPITRSCPLSHEATLSLRRYWGARSSSACCARTGSGLALRAGKGGPALRPAARSARADLDEGRDPA